MVECFGLDGWYNNDYVYNLVTGVTMKKTFKCAACGGLFTSFRSEEEKLKEMQDNFGYLKEEERVSICTGCYNRAKRLVVFILVILIFVMELNIL